MSETQMNVRVTSKGLLEVTWQQASTETLALIVLIRFVDAGCEWSTAPVDDASSPFRFNVSPLCLAVDSGKVQATAQLCSSLPMVPKGRRVVASASTTALVESSSDDVLAQLATLLLHQWSLGRTSSVKATCDAMTAGPPDEYPWPAPSVSVKLLSAEQAELQWKTAHSDWLPDCWMISLSKKRKKKKGKSETVHFYTADGRTAKQKLPVRLTRGVQYTVSVKPVSRSSSLGMSFPHHWMHSAYTTTFATPPPRLTITELQTLHRAALNYCCASGSSPCVWLYRNKSPEYFADILYNRDGIMEVYAKDNSGDPASPINGQINGLFFMAKNVSGRPPAQSYFGAVRLSVPVEVLLSTTPNVYFADFYCMLSSTHQVTLVATRPGSQTDAFCRRYLLPLDLQDRCSNPFLFRDEFGQLFTCKMKTLEVEVLYTENINVNELVSHRGAYISGVQTHGRGSSRPQGIPKNPACTICNLPRSASLPSSFASF